MRKRSVILLALLLAQAPLYAGTNVWTSHGPGGGNVQSLAIDPNNPATVYAGTSGGVFKSTDDGTSWNASNSGLTPGSFYNLALDPQKPGTLYAWNGKIFKSTDSGQSWSILSSLTSGGFFVAVDPQNEGTLYAVNGDGVYKSTDSGASWSAANSGLQGLHVRMLALDSQNPNTLYAGIGSFSGGVLRSQDGGGSWISPLEQKLIEVGRSATHACDDWGFYFGQITGRAAPAPEDISCFPAGNRSAEITAAQYVTDLLNFIARQPNRPDFGVITGVNALAADPQTEGTLYASTNTGVFKSTDGALTWKAASSGLRPGNAVNALAVDPRNRDTLYVSTFASLYKSTDGALSWNAVGFGLPVVFTLAIDPQDSTAVYAATNSGLYKSTDGGASWGSRNDGMANSRVGSLLANPRDRGTVYAGTLDGYPRLLKSTDAGASWINTGLSGNPATPLAIDPQNPDTLYAAAPLGGPPYSALFKSTDGGTSWQPTGLKPAPSRLVIDPQNPNTLYASSAGVAKSTDGGTTWSAANSGLGGTPKDPLYIESLTIDPKKPNTLYTAVYGKGQIFKTNDGGENWSEINMGWDPGLFHIYILMADPQNSGTVYAGLTEFDCGYYDVCPPGYFDKVSAGPGPGLFKSTDGGQSWGKLDKLPLGAAFSGVNALAIDPRDSSILYAVPGPFNGGVFRSTDGGASWTALSTGLTVPYISVLAVDGQNPSTVYAGTQGGGVFAITLQ